MALLPDLQAWLDEAAERHGVPGAAVAVGAAGELAEAATGVVNRNTGVTTTPGSVFQIGSVTKVWTTALVLQLASEGLVELDAPIRRYLPGFGLPDADAAEAVTIRQLLSHTGGFEGDLFEDTGRGDDAVAKLLEFMRAFARQITPPGAMFSYCNSGFVALGALVAHLRGATWEAALREHLIEPLGITHMALFADEAILFRAAAGHVGPDRKVFPHWQMPRSNAPAGSTPTAAPRELVRFGRMLLADGVAEDGTRILPPGAFAAMCEPQVTLPDLGARIMHSWGLSLMLFDWDGVRVVGHDGSTPGQRSCWRLIPDHDIAVALTTNGGDAIALIDDMLDNILATTAGITVPARATPPPNPFPATPRTGRYSSPEDTYDVKPADGGLDIINAQHGPSAIRFVPLDSSNELFIGLEKDEGVYPLIRFLDDGRFLYNTRALPRD